MNESPPQTPIRFWFRRVEEVLQSLLAPNDHERLNRIRQRCHDQAVALAAALLTFHQRNKAFFLETHKSFPLTGASSRHADAATGLRRWTEPPRVARKARMLFGRVRETDPDWLPHVAEHVTIPTPNPGRILHLLKASIPHRESGYTVRSEYLINGQRAAGLEPVALTALGFPRTIGLSGFAGVDFVNGTPYHRLDVEGVDIQKLPPDIYLDAYAEQAASCVAEIAPSLIHVHSGHRGFDAALIGLALARRFNLPLVYEVRGFFESTWSRDPLWNERGALYLRRHATETRCMREVDAVVTLSESMRAEIVGRGIAESKVFVVPNGVDTKRFYPAPRNEELVRALDLVDKFVFGYVSNLDHYREGHEVLIRAVTILRNMGVPAVALIIGDGSRRAELEALVASEASEEAVVFTGQVPHDEVVEYYRLLDVFVVPRVPERAARLVTPLKPFEAMAVGLPVVVSDLPSLQEIIGHGERGLAFRSADAESLADVLFDLWKNDGLSAGLAERGLNWVRVERQWSSIAARYTEVYELAEATHAHSSPDPS